MRREFPAKIMLAAFERAKECCEKCGCPLRPGKIHYDHVIPDAMGGTPTLDNCQVLCSACHGIKTRTLDVPAIAKTKRVTANHIGARKRASMPGSRGTRFKKHMDGRVSER